MHDRERIIDVPTGFGVFAKDLVFLPRAVAERQTDLRRWHVFDRGGHFAPAEQPDVVVDELRTFFRASAVTPTGIRTTAAGRARPDG